MKTSLGLVDLSVAQSLVLKHFPKRLLPVSPEEGPKETRPALHLTCGKFGAYGEGFWFYDLQEQNKCRVILVEINEALLGALTLPMDAAQKVEEYWRQKDGRVEGLFFSEWLGSFSSVLEDFQTRYEGRSVTRDVVLEVLMYDLISEIYDETGINIREECKRLFPHQDSQAQPAAARQ